MANWLANPNNWTDANFPFATPPTIWNGTSYAKPDNFYDSVEILQNSNAFAPGDVVAGTVTPSSSDGIVPALIIYTGDSGVQTLPITDGVTTAFSFQATTNARLFLGSNDEGPYPTSFYGSAVITPAQEPPVDVCDEIGAVSRAYVSAHDRTRIHSTRVRTGERRCLVTELNGAVSPARRIASATWRVQAPSVATISGGQVPQPLRATQVLLMAVRGGVTMVQCVATLDNGENYVQLFAVEVFESFAVPSDPMPSGSSTITVTPA